MKRITIHPMTLVEIIVAMSIFVVILYIVAQVFSSTQVIWRETGKRSDLHEQARLIGNVLSEDFGAIVADDTPGEETRFTVDPAGMPSANFAIAFVTASGLGTDTNDYPLLTEVGYEFVSSDSTLYRYYTSPSHADWDFLGTNTSSWSASWEDRAIVATNIAHFQLNAVNADGQDMATQIAAGVGSDTTVLPEYIRISFQLYPDEEADSEAYREFTKVIYLNRDYR